MDIVPNKNFSIENNALKNKKFIMMKKGDSQIWPPFYIKCPYTYKIYKNDMTNIIIIVSKRPAIL